MKRSAVPSGELEDRLPNLIIPGAAKAGTTTIHYFLAQHPRVFIPRVKEPHFFSNDLVWERGVEAYVRNHFEGAAGFEVRAEATPHYLFYEKAARRIAEVLPQSHHRFLVVLRDPVARAYSLYWNMVHEGHELLSFEEALASEDGREGIQEIERLGGIRWQYFGSGLYAKQIECWMRHFARERFFFVLTEDLQSDPAGTMDGVFRFLGLAPLESLDAVPKNAAARPRSRSLQSFLRRPNRARKLLGTLVPERWKAGFAESILRANRRRFAYPPMHAETERTLRERFASDVERLQSLIDRDLSSWLPPARGMLERIER
jgi:Sulfotransferase domain